MTTPTQFYRRIGHFEQLNTIINSTHIMSERIQETLNHKSKSNPSKNISAFLDWGKLLDSYFVLKGARQLTKREHLADKLSCFISLSHQDENMVDVDVAQQYWNTAYQEDAFQTSLINNIRGYDGDTSVSDLNELLQAEVINVAKELGFEEEITNLIATSPISLGSVDNAKDCFLGVLGQENETQAPRSFRWRHHIITLWLVKLLLEQDKEQGTTDNFNKLYRIDALHTKLMHSVVYKDTYATEFLLSPNDSKKKLVNILVLFRLSTKRAIFDLSFETIYGYLIAYCREKAKGFPIPGQEPDDVASELFDRLVMKGYYRLAIPWKHQNPEAYVGTVVGNKYVDIYNKETGLDAKESTTHVPVGSDENSCPMDKISGPDLNPDEELQWKEDLERAISLLSEFRESGKIKIRAIIAYYLLQLNLSPPREFMAQFASEISKSEEQIKSEIDSILDIIFKRKLATDKVKLTEQRNEACEKLFLVKFNTVQKDGSRLKNFLTEEQTVSSREE